MGLFDQLSQQQQAFQGLSFGGLGVCLGSALGQTQQVFQQQRLSCQPESKPKEKTITFYCKLKDEITDWLKISI